MSIILGALGGAGEAATQIAATNQKAWLAQDLAKVESDLAQNRAQSLELFKNNLAVTTANQQREAQNARIGTAQQGIVGGIAAKNANRYYGDGSALTNDDLSPEEQAQFAATDSQTQDARTQAAIQTGDIAPKDAMANTSKLEINQIRMDALLARAEDKNASAQQIAEVRADALKYGYELRLQAAQEKRANGKIDTATSRMLITSEDANIRASTSQLNMLSSQLRDLRPLKPDGKTPNPDYVNLSTQAEDLRKDIKASKANKIALFKSLNIMPTAAAEDDDTPAPAPAAPGASAPKTDYSKLWKK